AEKLHRDPIANLANLAPWRFNGCSWRHGAPPRRQGRQENAGARRPAQALPDPNPISCAALLGRGQGEGTATCAPALPPLAPPKGRGIEPLVDASCPLIQPRSCWARASALITRRDAPSSSPPLKARNSP